MVQFLMNSNKFYCEPDADFVSLLVNIFSCVWSLRLWVGDDLYLWSCLIFGVIL